jgi:hypothetical protein
MNNAIYRTFILIQEQPTLFYTEIRYFIFFIIISTRIIQYRTEKLKKIQPFSKYS